MTEYFYYSILDDQEPSVKGIGFILPNTSSSASLQSFVVSIDSVEAVTGFDFFPNLPDDQEKNIEKTGTLEDWQWTNTRIASSAGAKRGTVSVQFSGLTKAGSRCQNKTLSPDGFCRLHEKQKKNL